MRTCNIFYSWQSDLPNKTNRGFIGKALENAVKLVSNDDSIEIVPRVDRDTQGVPGSPDISGTILDKIDQAQIFVGDLSIIQKGKDENDEELRPMPNPNVLVEIGYALKSLGPERILIIVNTHFGKPELLPLDLRMKRAIEYSMPEESHDRASERDRLTKFLKKVS